MRHNTTLASMSQGLSKLLGIYSKFEWDLFRTKRLLKNSNFNIRLISLQQCSVFQAGKSGEKLDENFIQSLVLR